MDATTLFLLRLCGAVFLVIGLSILVNAAAYKKMLKELAGEFSTVLYVVGLIPLCAGMALVLIHNRWGSTQEILVTLIGWGSLAKGLVRLLIPGVSRRLMARFTKWNLAPWGIVILAWGGVMTWFGFA